MSVVYKAKFKCRLCKKEYRNSVTTGKTNAEKEIFALIYGGNKAPYEPLAPRMNEVHYCNNGDFGVADFIGWEREENG